MNKPIRYTLAILACFGCFFVCAILMAVTGVGGVIAAMITCFFIKKLWNGIVHYGEEDVPENAEQPNSDSQES